MYFFNYFLIGLILTQIDNNLYNKGNLLPYSADLATLIYNTTSQNNSIIINNIDTIFNPVIRKLIIDRYQPDIFYSLHDYMKYLSALLKNEDISDYSFYPLYILTKKPIELDDDIEIRVNIISFEITNDAVDETIKTSILKEIRPNVFYFFILGFKIRLSIIITKI